MIGMLAAVVLAGLAAPGGIGALLARRWGYGAWTGFAAGALGGIGGWMLVAALPRRRAVAAAPAPDRNEPPRQLRLDAADRGAHTIYRLLGVVFVILNLVWLVTTFAAVLAPLGFEPLIFAEPGVPVRGIDFAVLALIAALGLLCLYTAAADRRLTPRSRAGWLAALVLTLFVAAFAYVPWRRTRVLRTA